MNAIEQLLLLMLTKNGTMSAKGKYKPRILPDGSVQTVFTTGIADDNGYEYVVPGVKNGREVDPFAEFAKSNEYFAKFPQGLLGRTLSNYTGKLVHKWQAENNVPIPR